MKPATQGLTNAKCSGNKDSGNRGSKSKVNAFNDSYLATNTYSDKNV